MRPLQLLPLGILLLIIAGSGFAWWRAKQPDSTTPMPTILEPLAARVPFTSPSTPLPSASPIPFAELTIPYLRQRSYQSQLGELTKVGETTTYTSYRTSYDSDGLKIYGQLTVPKATTAKPEPTNGWPAIVFVHGYIAPSVYKTFGNYTAYVDALARQGFVVFKIDLRGHDQSEGEASGAYYASDYIVDTLNAYAALQTMPKVNPQRIGLFGHSMAGNVTMRAAVAKQTIPATVIWAGAVYTYEDMRKLGIDDNSYRPPSTVSTLQKKRDQLRQLYGEFDPTKEFWQQIAPTNYLDGVTTDFQFDHAVDDAVVNVEYSRSVVPLLHQAGITAELNEYPTGGHNLTGQTFTQAMTETVRFFNEHL